MAKIFPNGTTRAELGGEVADLIGDAARRIRIESNASLGSRGVTWAQVRALRACARVDRPIRMSDLADRLGIARRSATSVVDELEARGLVARDGDPDDRRAVVVTVTRAGRSLLAELRARRRKATLELTTASGLSDAELATLRDLLRRLLDG